MICWLCVVVFMGAVVAVIALKIYLKLTTKWCRSPVCLVGKTAIVTGANTGIGFETAMDFAKRGAKVILACRNKQTAEEASEKIRRQTNNADVSYRLVDLSSLASVRKFAEDINNSETRIDILVNNAGVVDLLGRTADDLQKTMHVNYFGPFLLTVLLLDLIKRTPNARIVNVSSGAAGSDKNITLENLNDEGFWFTNYSRSKLCNVLFTIELACRLSGTTVTTYSLHPGVVSTDILRNQPSYLLAIAKITILNPFFKSCLEGAQTTIYCSVAKGIEQYSGEHFVECHYVPKYKTAQTKDPDFPRKLWEKTEQLVQLSNIYKNDVSLNEGKS